MQLSIKYKEKNKLKTQIVPIQKGGILATIDNFFKCDIIYNTNVSKIDIKNIQIIYDKNELKSQTSERIASIILQVCYIIKKF